jgi:hypothetical protein
MPLTRVSLLKGKPPEYRKAILDGLYQAMRESFGVPEDDRFMLIEEYDKSNFDYGANYLGIARNDDLVIIQITVNNTRGTSRRFTRIFSGLMPGVLERISAMRAKRAFFCSGPKENWSFGNGIAQYT